MNTFVIVFVAITPLVMCYDEAYDQLDVDKVIADEALFDAYSKCILDKGPCTEKFSEDFKKVLPEVIATSCEKCTPIQKVNIRKLLKALNDKNPTEFEEIRKISDPKSENEKEFTAFLTETN